MDERYALFANAIRALTMDAVEAAHSGHPGMPMGAAEIATVLWLDFLAHDPTRPDWPNRDRFILSAGHGCMLLYSLLHLTGYPRMTLDEIERFRQWGSLTPGHPEAGLTPGVEVTTGPLGQGFANAVGMAMAERLLAARFNRPGFDVVDHWTWVIAGDGDLMEGISYEAASLAGHLGLGKLVVFYDDNQVSIDGPTSLAFTEDVTGRFEALGWHVLDVDGHDMAALRRATQEARAAQGKPTLIRCHTRLARGAPGVEGQAKAHGAPLGADEVRRAKEAMGWPVEPSFYVPPTLYEWMAHRRTQWAATREAWEAKLTEWKRAHPELGREWDAWQRGELPEDLAERLPSFETGAAVATRKASGAVIAAVAEAVGNLVGGSADLTGSNNTRIPSAPAVSRNEWAGRNIHFGVREHAMAAACNGMARHGGLRPFCGTFLQFSDYMRPAVRLAGLSGYPTIFVWTHDSILLGEDGPTHQPVEHLAALRAIPNLVVLRPADARETAAAWLVALERSDGPTGLCLTRQGVPVLAETAARALHGVPRGAYVLWEAAEAGQPDVVVLASGSEVHVALEAARTAAAKGLAMRVVSFPSWELFAAQPEEYRREVLGPPGTARVVVEAGVRQGWQQWAGERAAYVTVERFGASAPARVLAEKYGLTPANVAAAIESVAH